MGWNSSREANSNTTRWIDNWRNSPRQIIRLKHLWVLLLRRMQWYSSAFHVCHQRLSQGRKAHFCIAVGCWCITILATHVALSFDQWIAHTERLSHAYSRII